MKKALVIGAGPAGLTAAYELLTKSKDIEVTVFEESDCFGGISKTVNYKGNRMDIMSADSIADVLVGLQAGVWYNCPLRGSTSS